MHKIKCLAAASAVLGALAGAPAHSALYNDAAPFGPVVENFSLFDGLITAGPQGLAGGLSVSSSIDSTIGAFVADLGTNGTWGAGSIGKFAGVGDLVSLIGPTVGSMLFTSATPTYGIGAFINYFRSGSETIQVQALNGLTVLESHTIAVNTPAGINAGLFVGIGGLSQNITALRITGDGFVADDLRVATAAIPEPAEYAMLLAGLAVLGLVIGRRRNRT